MLEGIFDEYGRLNEQSKEVQARVESVRMAVQLAWNKYAWKAATDYTAPDFMQFAAGLIPGLLTALLIPIVGQIGGTLVGTGVGMAITAVTGQAEVVPITANIGRAIGALLADAALLYMGITFIKDFIFPRIAAVGEHVEIGIKLAWNAGSFKVQDGGHMREQGAREIAEGFGVLMGLVLMGIVMYLTKGPMDRISRMNESFLAKTCPKITDWVAKNIGWLERRYQNGPTKIEGGGRPQPLEALPVEGRMMEGVPLKAGTWLDFYHECKNAGATYLRDAFRAAARRDPARAVALFRAYHEVLLRADAVRGFVRETTGHVLVIIKLCDAFRNGHLPRLRALPHDQLVKVLMSDYGLSGKPELAEAVAADLVKLPPTFDFRTHDFGTTIRDRANAVLGSKFMATVAARLGYDAPPFQVLSDMDAIKAFRWDMKTEEGKAAFKAYKQKTWQPDNEAKLDGQVIDQMLGIQRDASGNVIETADEQEIVDKWTKAVSVSLGIKGHNLLFAHHNPVLPLDFLEFGIDTIAALCQARVYKQSRGEPSGAAPKDLNAGRFAPENGSVFGVTKPEDLARAEGWLCVIKKVAEGMGEEEFFKSPQDWIDKYKLPVQLDFKFLNKMCPEWIAEIDRTIQVCAAYCRTTLVWKRDNNQK